MEKRFKIRHKPSGKFLGGRTSHGLSPTGQLFTSKDKALQSLKSRASYKLPDIKDLEVVEYHLVEKKTHAVRLKKSDLSKSTSGIWRISKTGASRL